MTKVEIPTGLCGHLHQLFGGKLIALSADDPLRDSDFEIYPSKPVGDKAISRAVLVFYRSKGFTIEDDGDGQFCIRDKETAPIFLICVSNFNSQILVSTQDI